MSRLRLGDALPEDARRKLPFGATFVVWSCPKVITLGEKAVWYHHWALDRSPIGRSNGDHCYIGAASMAARLGVSQHTIEDYRTRLKDLGLLGFFWRREGRNVGWVALLPADCIPRGQEVAGEEAVLLGRKLAEYITQREGWQSGRPPDSESDDPPTRNLVAVGTRIRLPSDSVQAMGGRGEAPPSADQREAPLPPAVEDGGGARAPTARMEPEAASDIAADVMARFHRRKAHG